MALASSGFCRSSRPGSPSNCAEPQIFDSQTMIGRGTGRSEARQEDHDPERHGDHEQDEDEDEMLPSRDRLPSWRAAARGPEPTP
jgi:hypothetical protein